MATHAEREDEEMGRIEQHQDHLGDGTAVFGPPDDDLDLPDLMEDDSENTDFDLDLDLDLAMEAIVAPTWTFAVEVRGPNPAGNRFGTSEYIRCLVRSFGPRPTTRAPASLAQTTSLRRRRSSSVVDSNAQKDQNKRSRAEAETASTKSSEESIAQYKKVTHPDVFHISKPTDALHSDVAQLIRQYYVQHPEQIFDLNKAPSFDITTTLDQVIATETALEKRAITTAASFFHIQSDVILTSVGKSTMGALLTTKWWDNYVHCVNTFYVQLVEERTNVHWEREIWLKDALRMGIAGSFPGDVVRGVRVEECFVGGERR